MKRLQAQLLATTAAIAGMFGIGRKVQRDLMGAPTEPIPDGKGRPRSEQATKTLPRRCGGRNLSRILARHRKSMTQVGTRVLVRRPRKYEKPHPKAGKFHHEFTLA